MGVCIMQACMCVYAWFIVLTQLLSFKLLNFGTTAIACNNLVTSGHRLILDGYKNCFKAS